MQQLNFHLTAGQILALDTTPVTLVPPPGPLLTLIPQSIAWRVNWKTVKYSGNPRINVCLRDKSQAQQWATSLDLVPLSGASQFQWSPASDPAPSGGRPTGTPQFATKKITHPELLALDASPVQLVAAPPPGTFIYPLAATLTATIPTTGYGNLNNANSYITLEAPGNQYCPITDVEYQLAPTVTDLQTLLGTPNPPLFTLGYGGQIPAGATYAFPTNFPTAALVGQPLQLAYYPSAGPMTGGDAANSLSVSVMYTVIPIDPTANFIGKPPADPPTDCVNQPIIIWASNGPISAGDSDVDGTIFYCTARLP